MKTVLAIRHVAFEDLDAFTPVLVERGYAVRYLEAGYDDLSALDPLADALLVVLGGPIGVYEDDAYPFIHDELRVLRARLDAGRPTLGLCLGCQMIARALGARVYPGGRKEIGWKPLTLTAAGRKSPLAAFADEAPVLHWHGDTFDLPEGAELLASTDLYPNQAFAWGDHALALQFHVETTARGLERWFIGHACEIGQTPGLGVAALRADAARCAADAAALGRRCFAAWLDRVGL
ncbi:MAG: glutamine amidotransferase [Candidatus Competibacter sp.]|nr:glutamine amidotransferase [Candidatus Competibacter sp.]MDG4583736.1 glutamine amidotransferase [Candidatus Competibacter sp.]